MNHTKEHVPLLRHLGRGITRFRWWIIGLSVLFLIGTGAFGAGVTRMLLLARFEVEGSESSRTGQLLEQHFKAGDPNLLLLVTAKNGTVNDPAIVNVGKELQKELETQPHVTVLSSYWDRAFAPALRSKDAKQAIIIAHISGTATEARELLRTLSPKFTRDLPGATVRVGGQDEIFRQVGAQSEQDFIRSDMIAIPLVLLILVLLLRNLWAGLLTLGISLFAILGTMSVLRILIQFTEVSTFALNLTMVLGLGIGVDYCLFIIARYREELEKGQDVQGAIIRTIETAGRTVIFSALTVAISLAGLILFPFYFLRSFAYAGIAVIAIGVCGALFPLPAMLAIMGHRIRPWSRRQQSTSVEQGLWYRISHMVMKRPVSVSVPLLALLLFLGSPFLRINFGTPDQRVLPPGVSSREVHEEIRLNFPAEENDAIHIVALNTTDSQRQAIEQYARALSRVPGVFQVDTITGAYANGEQVARADEWSDRFVSEKGTWLSVVPSEERLNSDPFGLVDAIRAVQAPYPVQIGGAPAIIQDFRNTLLASLPPVMVFIGIVTFILLFFMTGSLLLPLKAILLNILSLSATFGALVWIFQEGNLSSLLGFTPTGSMEVSIPILMFCLAFGLSMDYEVFIMSRIKEEYDRTGKNVHAVALGLERSGPLVTAAAALMALAFASFSVSGISLLKMLGVGMTLAVLMDATVIRGLLVPAFMRLMGQANWWAPQPLQRLQRRLGFSE
ncbi:RND superfamily putative drug exporter [Thermosporothrix hazakensis]|jgi:RND superfamily putative drug exporter|uniref:RND superfamily putative drug exporter n=1 Tax=Thermosporothrix hazakensis TaxID=644383 RepID=A0A326TSJ8_THEHA|nr:MMPL family transporter [Thermosporothrix hazakensis]PZW19222.1 RND superfamily putative drug exporter [Thermosporothrix hazakensis]GCE45149.1 membrane protein [Thermosporothrix hazakensis]